MSHREERYTRPRVQTRVLQGGRRRRRWRALPAAVVILCLGAGAGLGLVGWRAWPEEGRALALTPAAEPSASAPRSSVTVEPRLVGTTVPVRLLSTRQPLADLPGGILAPTGILIDASTGRVLWAKRPHLRLPIASTTKIMTALIAIDRLRPNDIVTIHPSVPRVEPFKEGLRAGERVPTWKLLHGLMLSSGNDSALALAIGAAGSRNKFLALMNRKAESLGLEDTHFASPSGLIDENNYSTVWDLAALSRFAMWNPRFRTLVRTRVRQVSWPAPTMSKIYENHNKLLRNYPGANGIKTGWTTKAGHCYVASATRHGIRLIAVVLDSPDPYGDATKMLDLGFSIRG